MLHFSLFLLAQINLSQQGNEGSALLIHKGSSFPILWGSHLVVNVKEDEDTKIGLCRTGLLENCEEGLDSYRDTRSGCAVSTEDCSCWQWVFQGNYFIRSLHVVVH